MIKSSRNHKRIIIGISYLLNRFGKIRPRIRNLKKSQEARKTPKQAQKHHFRPLVKNTRKEAKNTKFRQSKAFN